MPEFFRESFDNDAGFTKSQSFFSDGFSDYLGISDGSTVNDFDLLAGETNPSGQFAYTGFTGSFLTGNDIDDSNVGSRVNVDQNVVMLDWTGIDISNRTNLSFDGLFAGGRSADTDDVYDFPSIMRIEVQIDGTGYEQILDIRQNDPGGSNGFWSVDTDGDGFGDGATTLIDGIARALAASIEGSGQTLDLRFTATSDSGFEPFAADEFAISGDAAPFTLTLDQNTIAEDGSATLTIARTNTSGALSVTLGSSDTSLLDPNTVVNLVDGQASTTIQITPIDDTTLQGFDRKVLLTGNDGGTTISIPVVVIDNERISVYSETFADASNLTLLDGDGLALANGFYSDNTSDYFGIHSYGGPVDFGLGTTTNSNDTGYVGFDGNYLTGQDLDGDGAVVPVSFENTTSIDITGLDQLTFAGDFAANTAGLTDNIDAGDLLFVEASVDGGAFTRILQFASNGTDWAVDADFDGTGEGATLSFEVEAFTADIAGTGTDLTIRVSSNAGDSNEDFGIDNLEVFGKIAAITGDAGDNTLTGTANGDSFLGLGGIDVILAGDGPDNVDGGDDADAAAGQGGSDTLNGGGGEDLLDGGPGNDLIYGGDQDDYANGGSDADAIYGGDGNDALVGAAGDDSLFGDAGNDTLDGGTGTDTLDGGSGNDRYFLAASGDVIVEDPGEGYDRVFTSASVTLADNVEAGHLTGSADLSMTAASTGSWLQGNSGNNTLLGQGANDRLDGNAGNDTLNGGGGNDLLEGGAGQDVFAFDLNGGVDRVLDFNLIDDRIDLSSTGLRFSDLLFHDIASGALVLYDNTADADIGLFKLDGISAGDLTEVNFITVPGIAATIDGSTGDDDLEGSLAQEILRGLAGNDTLDARGGDDTLEGGAGDDVYNVDGAGDTVIELAGEGYDRVMASVSYALSDDVEAGKLTGSADLSLTAAATGSWLQGNSGANTLTGGSASDRLDGNAGADRIIGGLDNDILEGGTGADDFVFATGDGVDRILDFELGVDSIDLTGTALAFGDLTISDGAGFALVNYGADLIRIDGVTAAQMTEAQFDLAP